MTDHQCDHNQNFGALSHLTLTGFGKVARMACKPCSIAWDAWAWHKRQDFRCKTQRRPQSWSGIRKWTCPPPAFLGFTLKRRDWTIHNNMASSARHLMRHQQGKCRNALSRKLHSDGERVLPRLAHISAVVF